MQTAQWYEGWLTK